MVVALLGHGTVGGGVYELLKNRSDITVKYVLDRSPIAELGAVSVTDFSAILNDGEVDTVVEVCAQGRCVCMSQCHTGYCAGERAERQ